MRRQAFHDRAPPLPGWRDFLRILREGGFRPKGAGRDAAAIPRVTGPADLPPLGGGEASVTWVGHATFVVRMAGRTVLTDPVWSERLPGGIRRLVPPGAPWEALPRIDAVVVSHNHYDHQDARTLLRLPRDTPILVGLGGGGWFRRRGFSQVVELDWWQEEDVAGLRFAFAPSRHWSRRGPFDLNQALWGSWVLRGGARSVYFAGDTGYGDHFAETGRRHPGLEVALLPVGAYEPRWFMRNVHMDPDEAVRAFQDLGAQHMVPMHWGTFPLTREPVLEPPVRTRAAWEAAGLARSRLWDLAIGETRRWGASRPAVASEQGALAPEAVAAGPFSPAGPSKPR